MPRVEAQAGLGVAGKLAAEAPVQSVENLAVVAREARMEGDDLDAVPAHQDRCSEKAAGREARKRGDPFLEPVGVASAILLNITTASTITITITITFRDIVLVAPFVPVGVIVVGDKPVDRGGLASKPSDRPCSSIACSQ